MTNEMKEIGLRLTAARNDAGMTHDELSERIGITRDELIAYEKGEMDFNYGFYKTASKMLGIGEEDLLSGGSPKLEDWELTRKDNGRKLERNAAYRYLRMAPNFKKAKASPYLVTVEPEGETKKLRKHAGEQEFIWVVQGRLKFIIEKENKMNEFDMEPGDSMYFDASLPHRMESSDNKPVQFLSIVLS